MGIYTSYYSMVPRLDEDRYCFIRVSKSKPAWLDGVKIIGIEALYPHWDLINDWKSGNITWEAYRERYLYQLSFLSREDIVNQINEISRGKEAVLFCYEANNKPCHRHILAEWLDCCVKELAV